MEQEVDHGDNRSGFDIEIQHSWKKLERDSKKAGFREGITNGRETVYQKSFDVGYELGFNNGMALGKYKALSRIKEHLNVNPASIIKETRKGHCQLCKNDNLLEKSIEELVHIQTNKNNDVLQSLNKIN